MAELDGVAYYDDSKGTNVGATVAALNGYAEFAARGARVILIAGGDGKGQDFAPLAGPVSRYARAVILIGRDAELIARRSRRERRCSAARRQHGAGRGAGARPGAARAMWCCCRRLAPVSTCSATTCTVAKCSPHA